MSEPVLSEVRDRIATITLHRPEARNALSRALMRSLTSAMARAEADDAVDVIVLTGTDPAFSAGVDLKELGTGKVEESVLAPLADPDTPMRPWAPTTKPVIGAINGVAITGALEVALQCDFLVASERARFADTHSRVGVMPGWGLSQKLSRTIGIYRAKQLSLTGNYLDAATAERWGLVNMVVPANELLTHAARLAADIVTVPTDMALAYKKLIDDGYGMTFAAGMVLEDERSTAHAATQDPEAIEARRRGVLERGRAQKAD